jgi:dihydroxyacetone synthase
MAPSLELLPKSVEPVPTKSVSTISNGSSLKFESQEKHQRVLNVFRAFIADLVQQYGDGHPG